MNEYLIEGNIDFYKELNDDCETVFLDNLCLITNDKLDNEHVELECGHKFNYDAIYNDVYNHKMKYNKMERYPLRSNEIRCPYCRNIQKKLLPTMVDKPNIHGINYFNQEAEMMSAMFYNPKYKYVSGCCFYVTVVDDTNATENIYCNDTHVKYFQKNHKYYCKTHSKMMRKKIKDEENMKLLEQNNLENVIINIASDANDNVENVENGELESCNSILKTGKNKGKCCGNTLFMNTTMCKRHYNLSIV